MKPFYLLSLLLSLHFITVKGQQLGPAIEWQKSLGGSKEDKAASIIPTSDNGYLVVGHSFSNDGQVTGHHGTTTTSDGWIVKLDENGNVLWQKSFGGTGNDKFIHAVEIENGDFICVGSSNSNDGDVSGQLHIYQSAIRDDAWAIRISKTGNLLWSKLYGGTDPDNARVIRKALDGGYIVAGDAQSNDGDVSGSKGWYDIWVWKLNDQGDLQWQKTYGNTNSQYTTSLATTSDGNYVISGYQLYTGQGDMFSYYEACLLKIDQQGNTLWQYYSAFNGPYDGRTRFFASALETPSQQLLTVGNLGNVNIGEHGKWSLNRFNNDDGFIHNTYKLRSSVTNQLVPYGYYQLVGPDNSFMLADSSIISAVITSPTENALHQGTLIRINTYDSGNNELKADYERSYGGSGDDYFSGMAVLANEEFIAAGTNKSNNGDVSGNHGEYDFWVVKFKTLNRITGKVYVDNNNNGIKDAAEKYFTNIKVESKKNDHTVTSVTNGAGIFLNNVDTGTYTTTVIPELNYFTVNPASKQTIFTTYNAKDSFDFALVPIAGIEDLAISLNGLNTVRPGFETSYRIDYANVGTEAVPGVVIKMVKPSLFTFVSASLAPASVEADTLTWNIGNVDLENSGSIIVKFTAPPPPLLDRGMSVILEAHILPVTGDETPANNGDTLTQIVQGSYDPNDKQEKNGGILAPGAPALAKHLTYTVRFQNTGTDTAFNVIIRDTLQSKFDWSSFQMVSAGHDYHLQVKDGNMLTWTFRNILLPDSNVNEPASHGYIIYRVKPVSTLVIGDTIKNSASIYFDFNPPVQTNTHETIIKALPPAQPVITGLLSNYCNSAGVQTVKITNLPATGSGITVLVKIDGTTVPVGADSTFSFNVTTLNEGTHNVSVQFSNTTANRITADDFEITMAVEPNVNVSANITTITTLATPVILTAVNAAGGGTTPLYTFAKDRTFTTIMQAESVNNTYTFDPTLLAIGDNKLYVRMKTSATCVVANTVLDSIVLVRSSVTGITDPSLPGQVINIYPNPFKDAITINGLSTSKTYTVRLFNFEGKELVSKRISGRSSMALTAQHQASGIYWLSIYDEKNKQLLGTVKMLKQ